jgi:hypothetical protein
MVSQRLGILPIALLLMVACATPSSHIMLGMARAPVSVTDVQVYSIAPDQPFEEIALLNASSDGMVGEGGQKAVDEVIARMKTEAARLGANGVILGDVGDRRSGSVGTGFGSDNYSRDSAVGVGIGGSVGIFQKTGKGTAIYVPAKGLCIFGCDR